MRSIIQKLLLLTVLMCPAVNVEAGLVQESRPVPIGDEWQSTRFATPDMKNYMGYLDRYTPTESTIIKARMLIEEKILAAKEINSRDTLGNQDVTPYYIDKIPLDNQTLTVPFFEGEFRDNMPLNLPSVKVPKVAPDLLYRFPKDEEPPAILLHDGKLFREWRRSAKSKHQTASLE